MNHLPDHGNISFVTESECTSNCNADTVPGICHTTPEELEQQKKSLRLSHNSRGSIAPYQRGSINPYQDAVNPLTKPPQSSFSFLLLSHHTVYTTASLSLPLHVLRVCLRFCRRYRNPELSTPVLCSLCFLCVCVCTAAPLSFQSPQQRG